MTDATDGATDPTSPPASKVSSWWRWAVLLVVLIGVGLAIGNFARRDVVAHWKVLATCSAPTSADAPKVSASLDTASCATPPATADLQRGWPVIAFALSEELGPNPDVTQVNSDDETRTVSVKVAGTPVPTAGADADEWTLVFVEVAPDSLPETPFVVEDAAGRTTVSTMPAEG